MFFFLNLYLQQVLGLGAFASGAALLPLTVTIMLGMIAVAPRLIARFGPKALTVAGLATLAAGLDVAVPHRRRRQLRASTCCPRPWSPPPAWRWRSSPRWALALSVGRARGGRSGRGHRQHQLPDRLRPRAGRHDRGRRRDGADSSATSPRSPTGTRPALLGAAGIAAVGAVVAAAWLRTPAPDASRGCLGRAGGRLSRHQPSAAKQRAGQPAARVFHLRPALRRADPRALAGARGPPASLTGANPAISPARPRSFTTYAEPA